jgi:hypothetical protein
MVQVEAGSVPGQCQDAEKCESTLDVRVSGHGAGMKGRHRQVKRVNPAV